MLKNKSVIAIFCLIAVLVCSMFFASCNDTPTPPDGPEQPDGPNQPENPGESETPRDETIAALLNLSRTDILIARDDEFTVKAEILYDGQPYEGTAEYDWTLCEGVSGDVASVTPTATGGKIRGLKSGNTAFYVSTVLYGQDLVKRVSVTVKDKGIWFDVQNMMPTAEGYRLTLNDRKLGEHAVTEFEPDVKIYDGTEQIEGSVEWESKDPSVAPVENGKIVGKALGSAVVIGRYLDEEIKVEVDVVFPEIETDVSLDHQDLYVGKNNTLELPGTYDSVQVVYEGNIVSESATFDAAALDTHGDCTIVAVAKNSGGEEIVYEIPVTVIDKVLMQSDLTNDVSFRDYLEENRDLCIILGEDITLPVTSPGEGRFLAVRGEFTGVLDGRGHSITGFLTYNNNTGNGYRPQWILSNKGILRNLELVVTDLVGKAGEGSSALIVKNFGTVDNVYVKCTIAKSSLTPLQGAKNSVLVSENEGSVTNCVLNLTLTGFDAQTSDGYPAVGNNTLALLVAANSGMLSNGYVISSRTLPPAGTVVDGTMNITNNLGGTISGWGVYQSGSVFESEVGFTDESWSGYWSIEGGEIRFGA